MEKAVRIEGRMFLGSTNEDLYTDGTVTGLGVSHGIVNGFPTIGEGHTFVGPKDEGSPFLPCQTTGNIETETLDGRITTHITQDGIDDGRELEILSHFDDDIIQQHGRIDVTSVYAMDREREGREGLELLEGQSQPGAQGLEPPKT